MKITESQLRKIIREEVRSLRVSSATTSDAVESLFRQYVQNTPELSESPKVAEAIADYDYQYYYNHDARVNQLVLNDDLYDLVDSMGYIDDLRKYVTSELERARPTKIRRVVDVIPRRDYEWGYESESL